MPNRAKRTRTTDSQMVSGRVSYTTTTGSSGTSAVSCWWPVKPNGWQSIHGGSFYLYSTTWNFYHCCVGCGGVVEAPAKNTQDKLQAPAAAVAGRGQQVEVISHGAQVDIARHLALGNVTVVDFYADWCGPCRQLSPSLEQMARTDPEIVLRKIDIVDWKTAVVRQYNIHSIPQVNVYSRGGRLVGTVVGADVDKVRSYVAQAKTGG